LETTRRGCAPNAEVLNLLARAYLGKQEFEKGLNAVSALVQMAPKSPDSWVLQGNLQYLLAKDSDAEDSFRRAVELDPKGESPRYALGRLLYQKGRHAQALEQFDSIVRDYPKSYRSWDNVGLCQEALGRKNAAIQVYLRAISLVAADHPQVEWPYVNLANLLLNEGETRRAFDLAVTAAERNPNSSQAFFLAGKALIKLDQQEKSIRWLRQSAHLDPNYAQPHYLLGQALRKLGRVEESNQEYELFKKILAAQPGERR